MGLNHSAFGCPAQAERGWKALLACVILPGDGGDSANSLGTSRYTAGKARRDYYG